MKEYTLNAEIKNAVLNICKVTASPNDIVAASFYGPHVCGYADEKSDINVLLIINSPKLTLRCHIEPFNKRAVSVLIVDQQTLERDVDKDLFGGLLVENILTPYEPLVNRDYLWDQEVKAKKRIVMEILGNLVLELPEMSHDLLIKQEFFLFESMMRKAALFPPITYRFLNMSKSPLREQNHESMMKGFRAALKVAAEEGYIALSGEYVKIAKDYIATIQRRKFRIVNLFKNVQSGVLRHIFKCLPKMMSTFIEDYRIHTIHFAEKEDSMGVTLFKLEDPKRHIYILTPLGHVSLSDKVTIEDFVRRTVPESYALKVDIKKLGGVLNAVYVLRFRRDAEERKIVVKVFKDWYGWKWFPLTLWALGTRGFAVLGKSRLQREYAISSFLSSKGINVPKIIYVSPKERLIFQEYIDGESLTKIIKQICTSKKERKDLAEVIRQVGREIVKVHELDVALGDCKPENVVIAPDKRIYFVDLEQAERGGDQSWDVAEFLYYSAHYASFSPMDATQTITKEFVEGYLENGGKIENIERIRSPRYVKVFSFFTAPHLLYLISNTCGEILKSRSREKL